MQVWLRSTCKCVLETLCGSWDFYQRYHFFSISLWNFPACLAWGRMKVCSSCMHIIVGYLTELPLFSFISFTISGSILNVSVLWLHSMTRHHDVRAGRALPARPTSGKSDNHGITAFPGGWFHPGGPGDCLGGAQSLPELLEQPFGDASGKPLLVVDWCHAGRQTWRHQLAEGCHNSAGSITRWDDGWGEHMAESRPDYKGGEWILQGNWLGWGNLEGCHQTSEPPDQISHQVPLWSAQVLGRLWDGDRRPRDQNSSTAYSHEGGGPLQIILEPPEGIWCPGSGKMPRDPCSVQGWTPT